MLNSNQQPTPGDGDIAMIGDMVINTGYPVMEVVLTEMQIARARQPRVASEWTPKYISIFMMPRINKIAMVIPKFFLIFVRILKLLTNSKAPSKRIIKHPCHVKKSSPESHLSV